MARYEIPVGTEFTLWVKNNRETNYRQLFVSSKFHFEDIQHMLNKGGELTAFYQPSRDNYGYAVFISGFGNHYRFQTKDYGPSETWLSA